MKTHRFYCLLLTFGLLTSFYAQAQKETDYWYFGSRAGLRFKDDNPLIDINSKGRAREGCTAISDSLGNLLFYSAGDTIFTRFHTKMSNGWSLHGHQSASQSSVIVQNPYSLNLYYLFTVDALGGSNGLKYSVIDAGAMFGQGSVLAKNIPLITPVAEKITAVDHRYSRNAWVIVHGSSTQNDKFYAYRITPTGVDPNPVVSQPANAISHAGSFPNNNAIGCMKVSPDGRKLALAMQELNLVELYDFDDETGIISNPLRITGLAKAYGIEFSRDGSKLYVSTQNTTGVDIEQFNLEAGSKAAIMASRRTALGTKSIFPSSLQLARNGKIYAASTETGINNRNIKVLNVPDSIAGSKSFSLGNQPLNTPTTTPFRTSEQGLPNFNQSYLWVPSFLYKNQCSGDVTEFTMKIKRQIKTFYWNFDDPDSGADSVSFLPNPTHQFTKPGTYNVTLTAVLLNNRTRSTTMEVVIYPSPDADLGPEQEICVGGKIRLNGPEKMMKYKWSTGSDSASITVRKPGTYWLEVRSQNGCVSHDTITITPLQNAPKFFDKYLFETCPFRDVTIKPIVRGTNHRWNTGSKDSVLVVRREGWYALTMNIGECIVSDSVQVVFKDCSEDFMVPNIITPNGDGQNETFMIRGTLPGEWHLRIYNRWGTLLYEDKAYRNNWPEKPPVDGTYYYILQKPDTNEQYKGWFEVAH
ncbi:gliding motility-associated C-terminal domain-containing protein [Adhaeribacter terreus]|uniref:Gliding motility-associated C-terminal domain-containing protein n=1 Tax=Adhaeribacter terreus TaxID=529703 RepID=A0ABW0E7P9_9BACT